MERGGVRSVLAGSSPALMWVSRPGSVSLLLVVLGETSNMHQIPENTPVPGDRLSTSS